MNILNHLLARRSTPVLAILILCFCAPAWAENPAMSPPNTQPTTQPSTLTQGMWVWHESDFNTDQAQEQLLDFCERFGFNRIFVQIHADDQAPTYTIRYPKELTRLVAQATERGIAVEALDGAHDMAYKQHQPTTLAMLDALIDLNQSMPVGQRFVGIHYDIEPYVGDEWKASQQSRDAVMLDLLTFYQLARQKLNDRGSDMTLACDIPMWYDAKTKPDDHCTVTFNGETKNLHQHIQDLCDFIGIMSYRQHALGSNSVTEHIANELAYAQSIGKQVFAGLETVELKDTPQITFFGKTPDDLWKQHALLKQHHANHPAFGGVFIHSYCGLRHLLLDEETP